MRFIQRLRLKRIQTQLWTRLRKCFVTMRETLPNVVVFINEGGSGGERFHLQRHPFRLSALAVKAAATVL